MSAFGRRNGVGGMGAGTRPAFGVARPMKGGETARTGGDQFPPIPGDPPAEIETPTSRNADAMARLAISVITGGHRSSLALSSSIRFDASALLRSPAGISAPASSDRVAR